MKQPQLAKSIKSTCFYILSPFLLICTLVATSYGQGSAPWVAPTAANQLKNPFAGNEGILPDAKKLYTTYCTPCHGSKGKGDGIAAAALKPKPADHTSEVVQKETDGSLYWKVTEGRTVMPTYKQALTDNQRWELINYIRTLSRH